MVEHAGRTLELAAGTLECPATIKDVLELQDGDVLVLLQTSGKYDEYDEDARCRNIWRVGPDGSVRWRIRKGDMISGECASFSSIWEEDGAVWAYNTNGLAYQVDLETGQLGGTRQMK